MILSLIDITRWPAVLIFAAAGALAVVLAFSSYNLFQLTMANIDFLLRYGFIAVMEGALWQLAGLAANGAFVLACYLGFKLCENELSHRYRLWCTRRRSADKSG